MPSSPLIASGGGAAAALAGLGASFPDGKVPAKRVAKELETVFLTQLLQSMRKTLPQSDFLPKSAERDVYDGMFDRTVAETMAAQDPLGFERSFKIPEPSADSRTGGKGSEGLR